MLPYSLPGNRPNRSGQQTRLQAGEIAGDSVEATSDLPSAFDPRAMPLRSALPVVMLAPSGVGGSTDL
jgi:hypothetical protein